jgi:hypothetical protein
LNLAPLSHRSKAGGHVSRGGSGRGDMSFRLLSAAQLVRSIGQWDRVYGRRWRGPGMTMKEGVVLLGGFPNGSCVA